MNYLKVIDDESTESELILYGAIALYGGQDLSGENFRAGIVTGKQNPNINMHKCQFT